MKYSFEEKLRYNRERRKRSRFADGYVIGAELYDEYPNRTPSDKKIISDFIASARDAVRLLDDPEFDKGVLCGYRDAANERKAKAKALTQTKRQARARERFFSY